MKLLFTDGEAKLVLSEPEELATLEAYARAKATADAEQAALSRCYTVEQLCERLGVGETTAYALITSNRIRSVNTGKKGYRVSEQAVREYLGDLTPSAS